MHYAKVLDKVDYKILLKKLQLYGIHPRLIGWIESFLSERMLGVVVNGQILLLALIVSGVPQGTVLAGLPKSSNIAEGWHNGFRSLLSCTNLTIRRLIKAIHKEQGLTDVKITKQRKWKRLDKKFKNLIDR